MVAESVEHTVHNMSWEWFQLNSKGLGSACVLPWSQRKEGAKNRYT